MDEGEKKLLDIRNNDAFMNSRGEYDLKGLDSDMDDYMSRSGYQIDTDSGFETMKPVVKRKKQSHKKGNVAVRTVGGESFTDEDYGGSDFESVKVHEYRPL